MKNLLIITLLLISSSIFAQTNAISLSFDSGILFSEYAQSRSGNSGSTFGLRVEVPVGNFAISSGVEKSNYGKVYNYQDLRTGGEDDPAYPMLEVTRFDYTYLSIPVRVKYNWKMIYAQVGVKAEMFKKGNVFTEGILHDPIYENNPNRSIDDVRKNNITTEFALGFNYSPKHSNLGLFFEPTVSYITKSIFANSELNQKQISYGLRVGAKYTFNFCQQLQ